MQQAKYKLQLHSTTANFSTFGCYGRKWGLLYRLTDKQGNSLDHLRQNQNKERSHWKAQEQILQPSIERIVF